MRAINASAMRQYNRRMLLNEIRRQPVSRAELAERTHLTRASVTQIIEELIGEGLVVEGASVERSRLGRRSTLLNINPSAGAILGVNLSRGQCDVGAVDLLGTVLRYRVLPVPGRSADDLLDEIAEHLAGLRRELTAEGFRVFAAGFCAPGPLEPRTGLMLNPPNFKAWHGVNVGALAGGDVDAHAGAAEDQRALKLALGDHRAHAQADAMEHVLRVLHAGVGHAHVGDRPALGAQMRAHGLLERIAGEIRAHQQLLVLDRLHSALLLLLLFRAATARFFLQIHYTQSSAEFQPV